MIALPGGQHLLYLEEGAMPWSGMGESQCVAAAQAALHRPVLVASPERRRVKETCRGRHASPTARRRASPVGARSVFTFLPSGEP